MNFDVTGRDAMGRIIVQSFNLGMTENPGSSTQYDWSPSGLTWAHLDDIQACLRVV